METFNYSLLCLRYLPGLHVLLYDYYFERVLFKMKTAYFQKKFEKGRDKKTTHFENDRFKNKRTV